MRVLVLGGTAEARELARLLHQGGVDVVSSLAGRVERPRLPVGRTRLGGFGGVDGLAAYLALEEVGAVVDATHPFAGRISAHAVAACHEAGVPLVRLERPGWRDEPGAAGWHWVDNHEQAARKAAALGQRVLLTTGRQSLDRFTGPLARHHVVVRVVDPVVENLPDRWTVLLDRGPYAVDRECTLMREHDVETLVTKDSGGSYTRAKLDAADALGIDVVVVRRPRAEPDVETVTGVDQVVRWLSSR